MSNKQKQTVSNMGATVFLVANLISAVITLVIFLRFLWPAISCYIADGASGCAILYVYMPFYGAIILLLLLLPNAIMERCILKGKVSSRVVNRVKFGRVLAKAPIFFAIALVICVGIIAILSFWR